MEIRKSLAMLFLALGSVSAFAQSKYNVSGTVVEKETSEPVISATVRILSLPDSSMVSGAATGTNGAFSVKGIKKGKYAVKITYIGFKDRVLPLDLTNKASKDVNIGYITMQDDSKLLKEAEVTANVAKVQVDGDSIVYNTAAYRVPEGSALEDLVRKMPGVEMSDDGSIKVNGKKVNKILVDGKEFFLNDTQVALKNIPTNIIDKIKTYDRKSDLARVTGIDDGEDETVLDLTVKKGMNQGWFGEINLGAGTKDRYSERLNVNRFNNSDYLSIIGGLNNTGDMGFGGGGGRGFWGGGGNGLRKSSNIGASFAAENDVLEMGGSAHYRYNGSDVRSTTVSQNFATQAAAFSNSMSKSLSSGDNLNLNLRVEWKPDSMTNIIFRPSGTFSWNNGFSNSKSATYNDNPNELSDNPLNDSFGDDISDEIKNILVNNNTSISQNHSTNKSANGELQVNRRLSSDGRNITLRFTGNYSGSESTQLQASDINYFQSTLPKTSNNRYNTTPGKNYGYSVQATYSEPIADRTYLQFSYRYNYSYSKNDRNTYEYAPGAFGTISDYLNRYRYDVAGIVDQLISDSKNDPTFNKTLSQNLSQFSEYNNYNHTISLMFRRTREAYNFSAGVDLMPQSSVLNYKYLSADTTVNRSVFNVAPRIDLNYKFSKTTNLRVRYNGRQQQPSMTNLIDVYDDSNPLSITRGNTGLKPSFNHNMNAFFNTYDMDHQRSIYANLNGGLTQNSISNQISYDDNGRRVTRPMNINGNWNAGGMVGLNTAIDAKKLFTFGTNTNVNFNNSVGYLGQGKNDNLGTKQTTQTWVLGERLEFGYRDDFFDATINGNINYNRSRNDKMAASNLDTYTFAYGAELGYTSTFGLRFSTDISMNSRRGYTQKAMNTNELLWNAQISQSFLKGNALTVSLEWKDILNQQSNISRTITALSSTDSRHNGIYQYGMLRVIYKLNIFGKGQGGFGGGFPGGGRGGFGGGFPGGGRGGFGGGRPF